MGSDLCNDWPQIDLKSGMEIESSFVHGSTHVFPNHVSPFFPVIVVFFVWFVWLSIVGTRTSASTGTAGTLLVYP